MFSGIAASACSILLHIDKTEQALEYLEKARAVILRHQMDDRSDIKRLQEKYPILAARYEQLLHQVNFPMGEMDDVGIFSESFKSLRKAHDAWEDLNGCIEELQSDAISTD